MGGNYGKDWQITKDLPSQPVCLKRNKNVDRSSEYEIYTSVVIKEELLIIPQIFKVKKYIFKYSGVIVYPNVQISFGSLGH